jgi:hypothetical protein
MTPTSVKVQIVPDSVPSTPSWFGEVAVVAHMLRHVGLLNAIQERVRFARARFGDYEVIDFVAILIGYAVSGEPTLQAFYERLSPFDKIFLALFDRQDLPHRSTLSRFLAALDQPAVEALRALFRGETWWHDSRQLPHQEGCGIGRRKHWLVTDVDGTRQAARQRALPHTPELPSPHRRFDQVCAPG